MTCRKNCGQLPEKNASLKRGWGGPPIPHTDIFALTNLGHALVDAPVLPSRRASLHQSCEIFLKVVFSKCNILTMRRHSSCRSDVRPPKGTFMCCRKPATKKKHVYQNMLRQTIHVTSFWGHKAARKRLRPIATKAKLPSEQYATSCAAAAANVQTSTLRNKKHYEVQGKGQTPRRNCAARIRPIQKSTTLYAYGKCD